MNNYINNFIETWKQVITSPSKFYENMPTDEGYEAPLKFAITNIMVFGIITGIFRILWDSFILLFSGEDFSIIVMGIIGVILLYGFIFIILLPIFSIIGLFIGGAILFILFKIVGGTGTYEGTVRIISYSSAVNLIAWIPILGWLIGLYQLVLNIIGGKFVHNLTTARSAIAVLIPVAIVLLITIVLFLIFGLAVFAALIAGNGGY